jgi:hypothetical protein
VGFTSDAFAGGEISVQAVAGLRRLAKMARNNVRAE